MAIEVLEKLLRSDGEAIELPGFANTREGKEVRPEISMQECGLARDELEDAQIRVTGKEARELVDLVAQGMSPP